jgi:hypothetical protein
MCQAIALTLDAVSTPRHAATDGSANSGKLADGGCQRRYERRIGLRHDIVGNHLKKESSQCHLVSAGRPIKDLGYQQAN